MELPNCKGCLHQNVCRIKDDVTNFNSVQPDEIKFIKVKVNCSEIIDKNVKLVMPRII